MLAPSRRTLNEINHRQVAVSLRALLSNKNWLATNTNQG
jgi:hypothetical protein